MIFGSVPWIWSMWRAILQPDDPRTPSNRQLATLFLTLFVIYLAALLAALKSHSIVALWAVANPITGLGMMEIGTAMLRANIAWSDMNLRRWMAANAAAATPSIVLGLAAQPFPVPQAITMAAIILAFIALWTAAIALALDRDGLVS